MAHDRPAALVTGSASGIGRAAALRLAQAVTGETIVIDGGYAATT